MHFPDNRLLHDTKMQEELVYYGAQEHLALTNADGTDPIAFECMVLTEVKKNENENDSSTTAHSSFLCTYHEFFRF